MTTRWPHFRKELVTRLINFSLVISIFYFDFSQLGFRGGNLVRIVLVPGHCLWFIFRRFHTILCPTFNTISTLYLSRLMGKPTICICETKAQISFAVTAKLISAFVFATRIVQFLYFLNPKFPVSSHLLCLYRLVFVRPVRKPHCWFSHEAAHFIALTLEMAVRMLVIDHYIHEYIF